MKVGIPREVKNNEYRVAITPSGVHELVVHGHEVFVEKDAGVGSSILDDDYTAAGATILDTADDVWGTGDLILKVKEPIEPEYHRMREGQTLFTYLHLAADKPLTEELVKRKVTGIAYETVELPDRSLPLLAPMSEVAGRLAPQVGAHTLMRAQGGRGVLMGGVSGVYAAKVVVIGAGVSGMNAAAIALGMQAEVLLLDRDIAKLRHADAIYQGHCQTVASNAYEIERAIEDADLVIGAVLVPGRQGPQARDQRAGLADEARLGAGRHLDRPGRLLRGLAPDDPRRPDLPGAQLGLLLRREHARRRAAHQHLRAHQRHPPVCRAARQPGLARRPRARTVRWRWASTPTTVPSPTPRWRRRTGSSRPTCRPSSGRPEQPGCPQCRLSPRPRLASNRAPRRRRRRLGGGHRHPVPAGQDGRRGRRAACSRARRCGDGRGIPLRGAAAATHRGELAWPVHPPRPRGGGDA